MTEPFVVEIPITFNNPNVTYKDLEPGTYTLHFNVDNTVVLSKDGGFEALSRAVMYAIKNELFIKEDE